MAHSYKSPFKSPIHYQTGSLTICLAKITEQKLLLQLVREALPEQFAEKALHCLISDDRLLIYTDSAGWASQIRFFSVGILNKIRQSGQKNVSSLQVKILPPTTIPTQLRKTQKPSAETVGQLAAYVNAKDSDELNHALTKLIRTLQKQNSAV